MQNMNIKAFSIGVFLLKLRRGISSKSGSFMVRKSSKRCEFES